MKPVEAWAARKTKGGYTRDPCDCKKCREEHKVSPFHIGPDEKANCGKCMADSVLRVLVTPVQPEEAKEG